MRRRLVLISVAGAGVCAALAVAFLLRDAQDAKAVALLRATLAAGRATDFTATEVIERLAHGKLVKMQARLLRHGNRSARIFKRGQQEFIVIDTGTQLLRLEPKRHRVTTIQKLGKPSDEKKLLQNYRPRLIGRETVAGRSAHVLTLTNRHTGNLAGKLWIDADRHIVLQRESLNAEGKLVNRTTLTDIRFGPPEQPIPSPSPHCKREPVARDVRPVSIRDAQQALGEPLLVPSYLPAGYDLQGIYEIETSGGAKAVELRYNDGLKVLSVYEHRRGYMGRHRPERGESPGIRRGPRRGRNGRPPSSRGSHMPVLLNRGAVKMVRAFENDVTVVIVGDLTSRDISRMASGMKKVEYKQDMPRP